jgi:hypothetical protein
VISIGPLTPGFLPTTTVARGSKVNCAILSLRIWRLVSVLRIAARPVHAGDCLEEAMRNNDLVEIHDLFYRRIKPGEQHVVHNHDAHISRDAFILAIERRNRESKEDCTRQE